MTGLLYIRKKYIPPLCLVRLSFLSATILLMTFAIPSVHAAARADDIVQDSTNAPTQQTGIRYTGQFTGTEDQALIKQLESVSRLISLESQPPANLLSLARRARNDIEILQKLLRSEGYYDAGISYRIEEDQNPVRVLMKVDTGDRYMLGEYRINYSGNADNSTTLPREPASFGAAVGQPARAEMVQNARRKLLTTLAETGYPLAEIVEQSATIDHADRSMIVKIEVNPGDFSRFGKLEKRGLTSVEADYLDVYIPWQEGEVYDQRKVRQARQQLLSTGLFSSVAFEHSAQITGEGRLPLSLRLEERKQRSIGLAGRWSTDEGYTVEGQWEHRNFFGREEKLSASAEISEIKQVFSGAFKKPHFGQFNQDLIADGSLAHEDTDAYTGPLISYFAGLQRQISSTWKIAGGIPLEFSDLSDLHGSREFTLSGLEFRGNRDTSNERFDPSAGTRLNLQLSSYAGDGDEPVSFTTGEIGMAGYFAIDSSNRYILAGRTRIGSVVGESTPDLPANHRFYAGGGSSIRGYPFQSVGPLGPGNEPLGGRSLFEVSAELRVKFSDSLGAVIFVDGGNAYDTEWPEPTSDLLWASGVGLRYFTGFGPLRLDLGFPQQKREQIDDSMLLYISIGQAF